MGNLLQAQRFINPDCVEATNHVTMHDADSLGHRSDISDVLLTLPEPATPLCPCL
jgi:hypothetical protein